MDKKTTLNGKHIWALSDKAKTLYNYYRKFGLDEDLAFELVELHIGDDTMYELGEKPDERRPDEDRD